MDRRSFLRALGIGAAATVPVKAVEATPPVKLVVDDKPHEEIHEFNLTNDGVEHTLLKGDEYEKEAIQDEIRKYKYYGEVKPGMCVEKYDDGVACVPNGAWIHSRPDFIGIVVDASLDGTCRVLIRGM